MRADDEPHDAALAGDAALTRLLGVHIAHGVTSETMVFASLLAERGARYESCVLMHEESGRPADIERFAALAHTEIATLDTGWRPNLAGSRLRPGRARVAIQYLSRIDASIAAGVRFNPDVVYSSQQHYDCRTATRSAASLEIPQIIHLHYIIGPWLRRLVVNRLRTADHVVAVSDFIRGQAIDHGVAEDRVTTIHNTICPFQRPDGATVDAFRRQHRIPSDAFVYGMVSRLDPGKGHMDALAAFDRVAADDAGVWLVIAGSGRHDAKIRSAAGLSSAADRIVFLGQRRDVPVILGAFDVFVHPAVADPCPLAVLEAMAAGLPIIGYADGGVPELVQDGESGLLARQGDVVDLTGLFALLRKDADMAVSFGRGAAERVAHHFRPERAGTAFAELVTSIGATGRR